MMPNAVVNIERNGVTVLSIKSDLYVSTELIAFKMVKPYYYNVICKDERDSLRSVRIPLFSSEISYIRYTFNDQPLTKAA
jgi:hypothetical protein